MHHPWLTLLKPRQTTLIDQTLTRVFAIAPTSVPNLAADALILTCDQTGRMVSHVRKAVRDYSGGYIIENELNALAPIEPGQAVMTQAGRMRAKKVVHTNIFDHAGVTSLDLQRRAMDSAIRMAVENGCQTVAFVDYTSDLRRALTEETAIAIIGAIGASNGLKEAKIVCFDAVSAWVIADQAKRSSSGQSVEDLGYLKVRFTSLNTAQTKNIAKLPTDAVILFTDANLNAPAWNLMPGGRKHERPCGAYLHKARVNSSIEALAPIKPGDAVLIPGARVPSRRLILAAVDHPNDYPEAIQSALRTADAHSLKTVTMPNPSMGNPDMQPLESAQMAVDAICDYLYGPRPSLSRIFLAGETDADEQAWFRALNNIKPSVQLPELMAGA
ncbi:MAG: macro domain-containing protein [Armatimonadetes bacterium]|nr:macro domain-containing protein [Armatimonadota bacterium]